MLCIAAVRQTCQDSRSQKLCQAGFAGQGELGRSGAASLMVGNGSKLEAVGSAALHDPEPRRPPVVQLFPTDFGEVSVALSSSMECCIIIRLRTFTKKNTGSVLVLLPRGK